ncbi:MAG: tRNA dihydrouridine synthase DusB [Burkholderiales bacterium]|nr:tRNA dihydrouridine synthase DusB [Burkholderiales bacterium]
MRIGPYSLKNRLAVAPMAGVTDRPFRSLCRSLGAGYAVSEMVASRPELWQTPKSMRRLDHDGEQAPIAVQIAGNDPAQMAEAARFNVERGAQIIDINMGCPKKKVCRADAGSALLRDEALVARILEAVVAAVDVPVTLKMRTGWSPLTRNAPRIAQLAEAVGVRAITVHGRTRACDFAVGTVEYDTIRAVKAAVSIPVIANGDIDSPQRAKAVLEFTGADAVMIGRAAQGRPWIFRDIEHYLAVGKVPPAPTTTEVAELMATHLEQHYTLYGSDTGVRSARKHIGWYTENLPGAMSFRDALNRLTDARAQWLAVRDYFAQLAQQHARLPLKPYAQLAGPMLPLH